MAELTKEWLQQTIAELEEERDAVPGLVNEDADKALAAMKLALASLEAEPVYQVFSFKRWRDVSEEVFEAEKKDGCQVRVLYTAPPETVSVPDAMNTDDDFDSAFEHGKAVGWNACRAAMLQGAEGNSPVIPDSWVACSERLPENKPGSYEYLVFEGLNNRVQHDYWNVPDAGDDCQFTPFWNHYGRYVTHWMPLPAAPQQEVKQ